MAHWSVVDPSLYLAVHDKPLWYKPSRGPQIGFRLSFNNEPGTNVVIDTRQTVIFGVGTNWHTPWRSYVQSSPMGNGRYYLFRGDGTAIEHLPNLADQHTFAYYTFDGTDHTFTYSYGGKEIYSPTLTISGTTHLWFLSRAEYPGGVTNRFEYVVTNDTVRLTKIIDTDGRETTFNYTNSGIYSSLISKVTGPYGQTAVLTYTNGQLRSITDMTNLVSSFEYTNTRMAKLITPYGTNKFDYYSGSGWNGIRITEHDVRTNFYLFGDGPTNLFPSAAADYESLKNYFALTETFDNTNFHLRNSYFWGPRQYANLSTTVRGKLNTNGFQISDVSTNDFNKGRTRHWLATDIYNSTNDVVGSTLAMERSPSPKSDGSTEGLITWYDHLNKSQRHFEAHPRGVKIMAWRVSDNDWRIIQYDRTANNRIFWKRYNYGEPGAVKWATNSYSIDANGDTTMLVGAGHEDFTRGFNAFHQLVGHTNAIGEYTTYEYDDLQRLTNVNYPNGLMTSYTYDANGFLATQVDRSASAGLRTNSYTWTNGLVRTHTDERGLTVTYDYDIFGRVLKTYYPDGTGITNVYSKLDLIQATDRLGFTNRYVYNSFRELTQEIDALNRTNTYGYCDCGVIDSIKDPLGNTTVFLYDNAGQQTRVTFPGGTYTDFFYDTIGRLVRRTDGSGVSITNHYTIDGHVYTASNAFGRVLYRSFDDHGHVTLAVDNNGATNWFTYDGLGRLAFRSISMTDVFLPALYNTIDDVFEYAANTNGPVATYRSFNEWDSGSVQFATQLGERIEYAYDLFDRKTDEVHRNVSGTAILTNRFKYDLSGNLTNLIDGKAQNTYWKYDQYGRLTNKVDHAQADMFRYAYDANGRLTSRWSPAKGTTSYSYDKVGNLTFINYPASTDITLGYDGNNRVTNMVDAVGTTRFTYAAFGALLSEDGPWENDTVSYTYDSGRRRSGLSVQAPNASPWSQSYSYDAAHRLSTLSSPAGTFTYGYHAGLSGSSPASLVKSIALPNTSVITNNYDTRARMLGTWLRKNNGTLLNKHEYVLNDLDQRTKQTRTAGDYVDYLYDPLGQLTNAVAKESGGVTNRWHEQFAYGYDAAGNLTNRVQHRLTNSFTVNSLNQLTGGGRSGRMSVGGTTTGPATNVTVNTSNSVLYLDYTFASTNHSLTDGTNTFTAIGKDNLGRVGTNIVTAYLPASPTYVYDSNGNLTYDGIKALTYDDENQLISLIATNHWRSEFVYDGKMRRRIRREFTWQNSAWVQTNEVHYVYDGNLVVQERDNFNLAAVTYTRGNDLSGSFEGAGGIGGLLAFSQHSTLNHFYYHADGNGNVATLLDTNQAVVAKYLYDPFGRICSMSGLLAEANLFRFSSKEAHPAAELVYFLYRYYDPGVQRWVNRDPLTDEARLRGHVVGESLLVAWRMRNASVRPPYLAFLNRPLQVIDSFGLFGDGVGLPMDMSLPPDETAMGCGEKIAREVSQLPGMPNDPSSRYHHCLASCRISRDCPGGRFTAWIAGDWFQDPWWRDEKKGSDPGDRAANKVGRNASCDKSKSCEDHCKEALENGRFY